MAFLKYYEFHAYLPIISQAIMQASAQIRTNFTMFIVFELHVNEKNCFVW